MKKNKSKHDKIAVVDIGSNSVRMVIYDAAASKPVMLSQTKATCKLAENMTEEKPRLNPQGRTKTLKALKKFHKVLKYQHVTRVVAMATAALRAVAHTPAGKVFHKQAENALGFPITIISGRREAQLMAKGLMASLPGVQGICADLGGGSLELASVQNKTLRATATLNLGSLLLHSESDGNVLIAAYRAREQFASVPFLAKAKGQKLYVIGGSWRAIGRVMKIVMGQKIKDVHGFSIDAHIAHQIGLALAVRKASFFKGLPKKITQRAKILPLAAIVLVELIEAIQPTHVVYSAHGLRDGALLDALE